jgi:hypothetical protein
VEGVFWIVGSVMAMLIAKMEAMKIQPFATKELAIQKLSLVAKMAAAFPNCGCVVSSNKLINKFHQLIEIILRF